MMWIKTKSCLVRMKDPLLIDVSSPSTNKINSQSNVLSRSTFSFSFEGESRENEISMVVCIFLLFEKSTSSLKQICRGLKSAFLYGVEKSQLIRYRSNIRVVGLKTNVKIRNRYNQVPQLNQDTPWESDKATRKHRILEIQEASPFPTADHKVSMNCQDSMTDRKHE